MTVPDCKCGHPENHCTHCKAHFVVTVLRELHEIVCDQRPQVSAA